MKKIIYIIPILLIVFLLNNVYGYTVGDDNKLHFENFIEFYDYIISKGIKLNKTIDKDAINVKRSIILNSEEFNTYSSTYSYHIYYGEKIYLFDKKPTINIKCDSGSLASITFMLELESINANYCLLTAGSNGSVSVSENRVGATTKFTLWTQTGLGASPYFYSKDDLGFYISAINFDLYYTGTEEVLLEKNPEFSFIPTFTENYNSCNLKLDIKNAPDYYKLEYAINSSSKWYEFDNSVGVTVENNCLVIARMVDENGDEIYASSYNVAILGDMLSSTYFKVDFDKSNNSYLAFTPILYNNIYEEFECYFSYSADNDNLIYKENNNNFIKPLKGNNSMDWTLLQGSHKYYLYILSGKCNVKLNFKLVNKNTGVIGLERSFDFSLNVTKNPQAISSTTNGSKDPIFDSGANSELDDNLLSSDSLEIDWSLENSQNTIKSFFESTLSFFKLIAAFALLLPAWITVPLNTLFILTIVIFVFHFIRG